MIALNTLLHLERPLAVLDTETSGMRPEVDRIIKLSVTWHNLHTEPVVFNSLINPECPILNTVEGKHGIVDADVADAPTFGFLALELARRLIHCDIAGFHVTFDLDFLRSEFARAQVEWAWNGHLIDTSIIYRQKEPHTLVNAYKRYVNAAGYAGAHDSEMDVRATEEVLAGQLGEYQDLPRTVAELSAYCFPVIENAVDRDGKLVWVENQVAIGFGKLHQGKLLKDIPKGYLQWMLKDGNNFSAEVKVIIRDALAGRYLLREPIE